MQETKLKLLERIVDRRQDSLYRFAYFRTGSQADAEGHRAGRPAATLPLGLQPQSHRRRGALPLAGDRQPLLRLPPPPAQCDAADRTAAALADEPGEQELREEYERIAGLLALLPEEQAEVIRLKTSDSLTFARIAEITGSTEATVKSRFRYGIGKLRKLINH